MDITKEYIHKHYIELQKSPPQIAEELGTYSNKVRRAIIKYGYSLRDRSEAQAIALQSGRQKHPTQGKSHDDVTKRKIAVSMSKSLEKMSPEKKAKKAKKAADNWAQKSMTERTAFLDAAFDGVRKASKEGSKLEIFLRDELIGAGFTIEWHKQNLIEDEKMHVDFYVPDLKTVIEIDGPAHFLPIWGQDNLNKHIAKDKKKNGLILSKDLNLLRVKNLHRSVSNIKMEQIAISIISELNKIKNNQGIKGQYVEIEV